MGGLRRVWTAVALVAVGLGSVVTGAPPARAAVPSGFSDELVVTVGSPTALAFTPDGRMLVTTQPGQLRVVQGGAIVATALDLTGRICTNSERGLLGVAVDPQFASNGYVFVYYSRPTNGTCDSSTVNRVSRFVMTGNTLGGEAVLIDNIPSPAGNHNAGDLQFGKDGLLYISVGDGGCDYPGGTPSGCAGANDAARDRNVLLGKILRIDRNGGIPPGNPFQGASTARCNTGRINAGLVCQETFAWGLRNPFRIAIDPNGTGTRLHINDVGQNAWEEIDLGMAGADYGWNVREGLCANGSTTDCGPPPSNMTNPIFAYGRGDGCASITGGAFVPDGVWPTEFRGQYLFSDYVCGRIFRLVPNGAGGYTRVDFASGLGSGSAVHLAFGPAGATQALYYTTYAGGGQVRRIVHTASNSAPTARLSAAPTSGPAPLTVDFDGSASSDPDGDALTFVWAFGDGVTATTSSPTTSHTYAAGTYTATLTVRDARGASSAPAGVTVSAGNTAPTARISSAPATFRVGETLMVTGSAFDAEDASFPPSAFAWTVLRHHADHTHPWASGTGSTFTFQAPAPEDLLAATNSHLSVRLEVTDSGGAKSAATVTIQPRKVNLTLSTAPTGLRVLLNGTSFTAPATVTSWEGWTVTLDAPASQGKWRFRSWSDGGARVHQVTTPSSATTYTATYGKGNK